MKRVFIRSIMGAAFAAAAAFAVGCTTARESREVTASQESTGTADVALSVQSVEDTKLFPVVDFVVTCPGFAKSGSFSSSLKYEIADTIGGVPAGPGCTVSLSAKSSDGAWSCTGTSRTFKEVCAAPRQSDDMRLQLACVSTRVKSRIRIPIIGAVNVGCHNASVDPIPGCATDDAGVDSGDVDADTDGGNACTTTTCAAASVACGALSDNCGGTLDCGSCGDGNACTSAGQCVPTCSPTTCAAAGLTCGALSDGCGGTLDCGSCGDGLSCTSGQCTTTCTPKTCSAANVGCGTIADGCGGSIDCGSCDAGQSCSAAGQCISDCTPSTCNSLNVGCGPLSDGCGGTLDCGLCGQGFTCAAGGQCVSTCSPTTCSSSNVTCGSLSDGCGGTIQCGTCGDGQTCSDAGQCVAPPKSACADNNGGAGCTPTEQRFVDKSAACYACMVNGGCLDDALFGDTGHECGDLAGNASRGAKAGALKSDLCLSAVDCILQPQTLCASSDVNICYCGSLGAGNGCATATSGANGACFQQEVDGLEHLATDSPSAILPDYTDLTRGAGLANQLFVCAKSNGCDTLCAQ